MTNVLNLNNVTAFAPRSSFSIDGLHGVDLFAEPVFMKLLCLERKRSERSGRRLVLMLLESPALRNPGGQAGVVHRIQIALSGSTRDSDVKGWYKDGEVIGVIFTEISLGQEDVVQVLSEKVNRGFRDHLSAHQINEISLSFHVFPDDCEHDERSAAAVPAMYPDLVRDMQSKRIPLIIKRCLDILGSLIALLLLSPLLIVIALAVKLTSSGPVLFRQRRLGQYGKGFTFLKFRSMHARTDPAIHRAFIKDFISDQPAKDKGDDKNAVYKITKDPRVTPVGSFLRRTSLDELPQFINVLAGHMSLVGPRPPIPYELESYEIWHRRRLLEVKPGITGLWQIEGRSRVKFDEMVRMDLEYARAWSLWLDIRILLRTPRAVMTGSGAY